MDRFLNWLLRLSELFGTHQLTAEEVLTCVPTDWICTIHGKESLRQKLQTTYGLERHEPGDGELYSLLKVLEARGLIELETRMWQNPHDHNHYPHQQCRKARVGPALKSNVHYMTGAHAPA